MFYNSTTAGAGWSLGPFDEQTPKVGGWEMVEISRYLSLIVSVICFNFANYWFANSGSLNVCE